MELNISCQAFFVNYLLFSCYFITKYLNLLKFKEVMIANKIEKLMAERGWNQVDLANKSGIHQGTISNILNEKTTKVQIPNLQKLANAFGITVDELMERPIPKPKIDPDIQRILDEMPEDAKIFFRQKGKMHPADVEAVIGLIKIMVKKYEDIDKHD